MTGRRSQSQEDYLKTVFALAELGEHVTVTRVAAWLGVAQPSASTMIKRLCESGLLERDGHGRVHLTSVGRGEAIGLVRKHRLLETFLAMRLGYRWDEVHDEAEVLEHAASDLLIERIADDLGHPGRDPHGDPIPGLHGEYPDVPDTPLGSVADGSNVVIVRVRDRSREILAHLAELGLVPGTAIRVEGRDPFGETLSVVGPTGRHVLGPMLVDALAVEFAHSEE